MDLNIHPDEKKTIKRSYNLNNKKKDKNNPTKEVKLNESKSL